MRRPSPLAAACAAPEVEAICRDISEERSWTPLARSRETSSPFAETTSAVPPLNEPASPIAPLAASRARTSRARSGATARVSISPPRRRCDRHRPTRSLVISTKSPQPRDDRARSIGDSEASAFIGRLRESPFDFNVASRTWCCLAFPIFISRARASSCHSLARGRGRRVARASRCRVVWSPARSTPRSCVTTPTCGSARCLAPTAREGSLTCISAGSTTEARGSISRTRTTRASSREASALRSFIPSSRWVVTCDGTARRTRSWPRWRARCCGRRPPRRPRCLRRRISERRARRRRRSAPGRTRAARVGARRARTAPSRSRIARGFEPPER